MQNLRKPESSLTATPYNLMLKKIFCEMNRPVQIAPSVPCLTDRHSFSFYLIVTDYWGIIFLKVMPLLRFGNCILCVQ